MEQRIERICDLLGVENNEHTIHALACAYRLGLKHVFAAYVRPNYYSLSLEERALEIGQICEGTGQLCKCLMYENIMAPTSNREFEYSRYYCCIYQYQRKFLESKFSVVFKNLAKAKHPELTKASFKWRFVQPEVARQLTNSEFNGMSFLGFQESIPIVFDSEIKESCCFVGGLDKLTKVKVDIEECCGVLGARRYLITGESDAAAGELDAPAGPREDNDENEYTIE